jgi:hypothetical protein
MKGRPTKALFLTICAAQLSRPADAFETGRLAREAVSPNAELAGAGRARLRGMGPLSLAALFEENLLEIGRMREALAKGAPTRPEWERLRAALDAVARQRDAAWSGLYWYTDLGEAKKAAAAAGRPILSLRLLGNLDEELSCANSRFFRTALYANSSISEEFRRNWILHWESVRPVPKITVDYGDGRKLVRTITGNSLHYVLTSNGDVVDVMPGLWGPEDFLRKVRGARSGALAVASSPATLDANSLLLMRAKLPRLSEAAFARTVRTFEDSLSKDTALNEKLRQTIHEWLSRPGAPVDLPRFTNRIYDELFLTPRSDPWLGLVAADTYSAIEGDVGTIAVATTASPDALSAANLTASKMLVEKPVLTAVSPSKR